MGPKPPAYTVRPSCPRMKACDSRKGLLWRGPPSGRLVVAHAGWALAARGVQESDQGQGLLGEAAF